MKTKVVDAPAGEGIQYLTDEKGKRLAVILTMEAWEDLLTRLEDAEDALDLAEALAEDEPGESIPLAQVRAELGL